jgi:hypothetical protein
MLSDLTPLLLDLTGLDETAIEALGVRTYCDTYLQMAHRGTLKAHDGEEVVFFKNVGTSHALHQTIDGKKSGICPQRVKRVKWIKEFIAGNVEGSECWMILDKRGYQRRLYCSFHHGYLVWLSERGDGWKFETAYEVSSEAIRRYRNDKDATFVCSFTSSPSESPQPSSQSDSASSQIDASPETVLPCLLPDDLTPAREGSS